MRTNSPDADDAAPPSRMAVVFVVRGGFSNVQKTLDCLLAQTAANRIDLMLTTDSPALLQEIERYVVRWTPKTGPGNKVDFPWFNFGGEDGR